MTYSRVIWYFYLESFQGFLIIRNFIDFGVLFPNYNLEMCRLCHLQKWCSIYVFWQYLFSDAFCENLDPKLISYDLCVNIFCCKINVLAFWLKKLLSAPPWGKVRDTFLLWCPLIHIHIWCTILKFSAVFFALLYLMNQALTGCLQYHSRRNTPKFYPYHLQRNYHSQRFKSVRF